MPKTTSMMSKCLVYIVYFVWNMMKHMPHMSTLHLQYLCFVFVLRQAHFNWVGQGHRGGPACQSVILHEACAEMQRNLLDVPGIVDEDHG